MSGRGKGGKGLGKGGAKRHRKILRDNIRMFLCMSCANKQRESQSPLSVVLLAVVVSSVSPASSTKRLEVSSRSSLKVSSAMLSPTPSTPSERPSPLSMSSMLSSVKDAQSTVSVVRFCYITTMGWGVAWVCLVVSDNPASGYSLESIFVLLPTLYNTSVAPINALLSVINLHSSFVMASSPMFTFLTHWEWHSFRNNGAWPAKLVAAPLRLLTTLIKMSSWGQWEWNQRGHLIDSTETCTTVAQIGFS